MSAVETTCVPEGLAVWIDAHEGELVDVVSDLVRVPSVGAAFDPDAAHPFGEGCARVVDETRAIVERYGLQWENHEYYAMSARLSAPLPNELGKARGAIAFFSHLDVVSPGEEGWSSDPFTPYVRDGWLFGRGSSDNKGAFASVLFALRYLREARVLLRHDVVLYGGCDEERGMEDVKYLMQHIDRPVASLVSDAYFPVCFAEKGIVTFALKASLNDDALLRFEGGTMHNAVPDLVRYEVETDQGSICDQVYGRAAHAAFPEHGRNAIALAAGRLAGREELSPDTRRAMRFIEQAFTGYDGAFLGVAAHDEELGDTTCVATCARLDGGVLTIEANMRYPVSADRNRLLAAATDAAGRAEFSLSVVAESPGYRVDPASPQVKALSSIVNDQLGTNLAPYAMGGGTHARWIPGAIGFGPGRRDAQAAAFPGEEGKGRAHGPDEAVSIESLKDAIAIYVRAVLYLDAELA